jgi:DNA-binding PadR family transcriptional regulator
MAKGKVNRQPRVAARGRSTDLLGGLVPLYILYRAGIGPVAADELSDDLAHNGLAMTRRSIAQLLRSLEGRGLVVRSPQVEVNAHRRSAYRASTSGRVAIMQLRERFQTLLKEIG